jgi:TPP-dependent pyruvate/acetoin dehydrogenase alpha subunit
LKLQKKLLIQMLKQMIEIRAFEEKCVDQYARGKAVGIVHLYIGEEAVAVGTCTNLRKDDFVASTHRGHGHCIAKGGDVKLMMAELFARKTGYCKGKGGSMHLASSDISFAASGIAGSGIPIGIGAALSAKLRKTDQVAVSFFGDGSSNQGFFHEGANFASLYKLPVIFVCENNLYGLSVAQKRHQAIVDIACRAVGYNMPGVVVDGNDVIAVYEAVKQAVKQAREGKGPTLIECKTYRLRGHHEGDPSRGTRYRTKEEIAEWEAKCPIKRFTQKLLEEKVISKAEIKQMESEAQNLIEEAVTFAKESPYPEPEELLTDLYVD